MSLGDFRPEIPFLPDNEPWEDWNGSMLQYFGQEPLPYVTEDKWAEFAMSLVSTATFSVFAIPSPDGYSRWQEWVLDVIEAVNGPTK